MKFEAEKVALKETNADPTPSTPIWLKSKKRLDLKDAFPVPMKMTTEKTVDTEWLNSDTPELNDLSPQITSEPNSEILIESKTINLATPKAAKSAIKSNQKSTPKSVRIAAAEENTGESQTTPTRVAYDLRKLQLKSPFNNRRMPLRNPVATSTPNN